MRRFSTVLLAALLVVSATFPLAVAAAGSDTTDTEALTIEHSGEKVTVANASSQVISGTADAPKGTEVRVRIRSTGDTNPGFFQSRTAVVTEDGTWGVAFDLSRSNAGATMEVEATIEDTNHSVTMPGEVVACNDNCTDEPPKDTPTAIPEQTPTKTATEQPTTVSLNASAVSVVNGEVAAVELAFGSADTAVVTIGDEQKSNYALTATVRDADGDGSAVLYFDTVLAGRDGQTISASGGDEVELQSETTLNNSLAAGNYDLTVYAGEEASGEPTTLGTMLVEESAATGTATATDRPEQGGSPLNGLGGAILSVVFLVGGGAVALLLVRR